MPEHLMQINIPRFQEAQRGSMQQVGTTITSDVIPLRLQSAQNLLLDCCKRSNNIRWFFLTAALSILSILVDDILGAGEFTIVGIVT